MTTYYTPLDIPFFEGQDESADRKVLPIGPLRRVQNSFQERSGRMVEKYGRANRPTIDNAVGNLGSHRYKNSWANGTISAEIGGDVYGVRYADNEVRRLDSKQASAYGYEDTLNAVPGPGATETWSPCIAISTTHILFVYASGTDVNRALYFHIDAYNRDTRVLERRYVREIDGIATDFTGGAQIKVSANTSHDLWCVAYKKSGTLELFLFNGITVDWPEIPDRTIEDLVFTSSFDLSDDTQESQRFWVCAFHTDDVLRAYSIFRQLPLFGQTYERTLDQDFDGNFSCFCGVASRNINTATFALSYRVSGGGPYRIETQMLVDGSVTEGVLSSSDQFGAPCLAMGPGTDTIIAYGRNYDTQVRRILVNGSFEPFSSLRQSFPHSCPIVASDQVPGRLGDIVVKERTRLPVSPDDEGIYDAEIDIRGSTSIVNADERLPTGILGRAGSADYRRSRVGVFLAFPILTVRIACWTPSKCPVYDKFQFIGVEQRIPLGINPDTTTGGAGTTPKWVTTCSVRVLNNKSARGQMFSDTWDNRTAITAGAGVGVIHDPTVHFGGFTGAPAMKATLESGEAIIDEGAYTYQCILEYTDPSGRVWSSVPSDTLTITSEAGPENHIEYAGHPCAGYPEGTRLVFFRSERENLTPLYRFREVTAGDIDPIEDTVRDAALVLNPGRPYTAGGALQNDPPPLGRYVVRTRDRFWVGRQELPARVQSSKFLRPAEGIHWNNADQYALDMPEAVTGLASMDDRLVVFSENSIHLVNSASGGVNDQGIGSYPPPQKIPTDVGTEQARSIVTTDAGVFFLSRRGIELLNRGFSAPIFVGDPVRDVTDQFRFCEGAIYLQEAKQVRWLMTNGLQTQGRDARIVVLDTRVQSWSVFQYSGGSGDPSAIGRAVSIEMDRRFPRDGMATYGNLLSTARRETIDRADTGIHPVIWETGEIRPAGLSAGALGRRMNILGTFMGPVDLKIEMAFDDAADFHPTWHKTWVLDDDYSPNDPVQLELTLPKQKFFSVRFRLTATRHADTTEGFRAHGLTIFLDTEGEGPRVGARQKG